MQLFARSQRSASVWALAFVVGAAIAFVAAALIGPVDLTVQPATIATLLFAASCLIVITISEPQRPFAVRRSRAGEHPVFELRATDPGLPGRAWPRAPGSRRLR